VIATSDVLLSIGIGVFLLTIEIVVVRTIISFFRDTYDHDIAWFLLVVFLSGNSILAAFILHFVFNN